MTSVLRRYARASASNDAYPPSAAPETRSPVVLMVSGGADSTALLVLAATSAIDVGDGRGMARVARERLHVLHVNHQLRGVDAEEDEEFVRDLAARYGIPCTVRRVDVAARAAEARAAGDPSAANVEAAGREVRYGAARELANELSDAFGTPRSAARILTAHTANDRAETFLMNAVRGTGPAGLSSIPRQRGRIVRPLLDRTHEELCELLRMRGIVWREDATNRDTRYLRAFVRHVVLPPILQRNPRVMGSVATTCDILGDEDAYLTQVASRVLRDLTRRQADGLVALDVGRLGATDVAVARRVVRQALLAACPGARLEARHVAAVLSCVAAGTGSVMVPVDVEVRVEHGLLFVRAPRPQDDEAMAAWLEVPGCAVGGSGSVGVTGGRALRARLVRVAHGTRAPDLAQAHALEWEGRSVLLDAQACGIDALSGGSLWVDVPAAGDVVRPLGMHGQSKKVSDLLGEAQVPVSERAAVPLVRRGPTGPILWVAGIRPSEDARATPDTHLLLELTLEGGETT